MSNANILNLRQSMILGDELKNLKKKRNSMVVGKKKSAWNPFSKNVWQQANLNAANAKIANIRSRLNKSRVAQQAQRNRRMAFARNPLMNRGAAAPGGGAPAAAAPAPGSNAPAAAAPAPGGQSRRTRRRRHTRRN